MRVPVVLAPSEVREVLGHFHGVPWLMASLLYGAGPCVLECCRLCVKDVDFDHLHESVLRRAVKAAVRAAGIPKHATCHTLRHCFAAHLLEAGHDIGTIQELRGHRDVTTTMSYTHVLDRRRRGVRSPRDEAV